ncbi:hypothetical protein AAIH25_12095 [Arthrobacter crystallopoietes]|uniref:hypothetical protein n=1 Tax=Crystallibacter crystallopoietes TaxID=37928 RepID=UPI003D1BC61E
MDRAGRNAVAAANVVVNNDQDALYCGSASNAEHKAKRRAVSYGTNPYNPYYAVGSQGYMGQGDSTVTRLRETAAG